MIQLAKDIQDLFDGADPQFERWAAGIGQPISCKKGCAACCDLLALIIWPEGVLIAEHLRESGLVERFLPALQEQARRCCYDGVDQASYFAAHISCALLNEDRTCAVYRGRPSACRFHVVLSDAALCADRTPGAPVISLNSHEGIKSMLGPVIQEMAEQGFEEAHVAAPIPIMVLGALRQLEVDVGNVITPLQWYRTHGERVWAYYRSGPKPIPLEQAIQIGLPKRT